MAQQKMTLENYKKQVEEGLTKELGEKKAKQKMKEYETDFPTFLKNGYRVGGTIAAIMMGW
jgi:hypothetical protein